METPTIIPIPGNPPSKSGEAAVHKGILRSKTKISALVIVAVVAVVLTLALFNQPQQMVPNNKKALYDIGYAYLGQSNYRQAIQYFDKALTIDPKFENALEAKGEALGYLGNYTQAIQYLDKALAIDPNDKVALNDKGWALNSLGNYTGGIAYLDKALAIDHNSFDSRLTLSNKAWALNGLGNYEEATRYLDKALAIDPNFADALNMKSAILDSLGNTTRFQKYENSTYGIKIQYPLDWRVHDASNSSATDPIQTVAWFHPKNI